MGHTAKAIRNPLVFLFLCLGYSQTCLAQVDSWERVKVIDTGRNVHVKLHRGKAVKGKMDAWRAEGMSVRQGKNKIVSIEKSDVARVALVIGRSRGRKALLAGLIAGGITGGITVAAYASEGCCDISPAVVPLAAGFWGGIAAGIAALFPPHLEVIYSAPAPSGTLGGTGAGSNAQ